MHSECIIELINASIGYKTRALTRPVLNKLNYKFYPSDFIGVVGLNGIGKSTLLKSLCGLLPLLSGEIKIEQRLLTTMLLDEIAKKIAVVLTEKIGGFNLTVFDVVSSGQIPYTNSFHSLNKENYLIIDEAIKTCGLSNHQHKLLNELSDGLFQKTIIAKALAQQTPILLLDEPSAFLDYSSKHDLFLLLKNLSKQQNKCILVSSHDLDLLIKYCNKLLIISENETQLISTSEAQNNQAFLSIGGGFI